ncbi:hypothetical protein [Arenibacter aquaticus]|nr:hypothetical protein [Arenibacter aquaticus]
MNISMPLLSVLLVLVTVIPFLILNYSGKGEAKMLRKKADSLKKEFNLKFNLEENWGNSFIGLDTECNTLVFLKVFDGVVATEIIDLAAVDKSEIIKKDKVVRNAHGKEVVLEKLDLRIAFFDTGKPDKLLNFYDLEDVYLEDYELRRAEKWNAAIANTIVPSLHREQVA